MIPLEVTMLNRQLDNNNSYINRLLTIIERLQRENTGIVNRIHNMRNVERSQPRATLPEEIFYFYLPRNEVPAERLSQNVIERETSLHNFDDIENPNNLSCPICLEVFQPEQEVTMINHCRHLFNSAQLATWFETNTTCPVCRHNLNSETPVQNLRNLASQVLNSDPVNQFLDSVDDEILNIINRFR